MDADMIRELYDYHMALNRRVWNECIMQLTDDQFIQTLDYSQGSIRSQTVHMTSVDRRWFAGLQGQEIGHLQPEDFADRVAVRAQWDEVEARMNRYLEMLTTDTLRQPVRFASNRMGEVEIIPWEVLLHVVNHGTDHRAQVLAMLHQLGAPTLEQDLMIYLWAKKAGN